MEDRETRLLKGGEYQDYLTQKLVNHGIVLMNFSTAKYQDIGENVNGFEIKLDENFKNTGNLYFETHGTWNENDPSPYWVERGILKNDNTWLYLIGDYSKLFILAKNQLKAIFSHLEQLSKYGVRLVSTNRSKGFIVPISFLRERHYIIKEIDL